jgi:ribosomal protein S18 acetylase RimI-like enzyme
VPFVVRDATLADARAIAEVHVRSWQAAYRGLLPDDLLESLSAPDREAMWRMSLARPAPGNGCLVAEEEGDVIGFAAFGPARKDHIAAPPDAGEVYAIYLAPERFGRGVGRTLLSLATDRLREAGFRSAVLWVLEANERARGFYELMGWRVDGATTTERIDCLNLPTVRYAVALR